jgi:hypothetical protein
MYAIYIVVFHYIKHHLNNIFAYLGQAGVKKLYALRRYKKPLGFGTGDVVWRQRA